MKKQTGFTLIELVVVIVILGILAATAAPKFIDLTGDARASVVEALKGSLKSARDMAHAKALIESQTTGDISVAGTTVTLANGWPNADTISNIIELDGDISETTAGTFQYIGATTQSECQVVYTNTSDSNVAPDVTATTTGC